MLEVSEVEERYLKIAKRDGINEQEIKNIEHILGITLPNDFKEISQFFSGGCLGVIDNYSFIRGKWDNIIDKTIRLRETVKLPCQFVVLAEPPESLVVMDVEKTPSVIWCNAVEADKLGKKSYISNSDIWENYSDFFSELLSDEENEILDNIL